MITTVRSTPQPRRFTVQDYHDYEFAHPTPEKTLMVMEIADSSLEYDRTVKLALYAEAEIRDYWIFNVSDRYLETYSDPAAVVPGQFGYRQRELCHGRRRSPCRLFRRKSWS